MARSIVFCPVDSAKTLPVVTRTVSGETSWWQHCQDKQCNSALFSAAQPVHNTGVPGNSGFIL